MEEKNLLERWKTISKKEEKDNPFGRFVVDEGEFVTITPGVKQLKVEELYEEEKVEEENGNTNNKPSISK
jgi:hypothetical protein